jgi:chorismate mutase
VCAIKIHLKKSPWLANKCRVTVIFKGGKQSMGESAGYFVVKKKAVPEVLLKVVEAKRLLETEKVMTVQEAVDIVGISRSSFYKYKDDIFQFHDNSQGTTLTLTFQMDDEPGILSDVLKIIAENQANILTIHQSIPINGIASLSLSVQILQTTGDISGMIDKMEQHKGVHHVKVLAKE